MNRRIARMTPRSMALAALLALVPMAGGCLSDEPIRRPEPLVSGSPFRYPVDLWDEGAEGETVLMVHITALGEVDSAYVFRPSGYPQFDSAAIAGAYDLRFTPGRRGEERIDMWARLPVRFSREDTVSVRPPEGNP